jgi:hypothetical protein
MIPLRPAFESGAAPFKILSLFSVCRRFVHFIGIQEALACAQEPGPTGCDLPNFVALRLVKVPFLL